MTTADPLDRQGTGEGIHLEHLLDPPSRGHPPQDGELHPRRLRVGVGGEVSNRHGVTTTLPTSVPALPSVFSSRKRWAAAVSASGNVLPMGGRSFFSASQRLMSSAQA